MVTTGHRKVGLLDTLIQTEYLNETEIVKKNILSEKKENDNSRKYRNERKNNYGKIGENKIFGKVVLGKRESEELGR